MSTSRRELGVLVFGLVIACLACGGGGVTMPPKGAMPASATWTGVYDTNFGPLAMKQKPNGEVIGLYKYVNAGTPVVGAFIGQMDGNYLPLVWAEKEGGAGKGKGVFVISADGNSFKGTWGTNDSDNNGGEWSGTRTQ